MADITKTTDYQVQIEGTTYPIVAIPDAGAALVTKEKQRVLRNLKLDKMISDLMRAGELLFVVYNGVAGSTRKPKERWKRRKIALSPSRS
jgi:hypothetical protein